jgi:hypothetical protein
MLPHNAAYATHHLHYTRDQSIFQMGIHHLPQAVWLDH